MRTLRLSWEEARGSQTAEKSEIFLPSIEETTMKHFITPELRKSKA
jgi:hypothetical protein